VTYNIQNDGYDHEYSDLHGNDEGYDTNLGSEGSDGGGDPEGEPGPDGEIYESRRFFTAPEALMNENPRVEPQRGIRYPPQFGPRFQVAGFLYPIPSVNYQPRLNYSKAELKNACRDFPIVGCKRHSKESKEDFLQWMLNEMGAMMSLIHGDEVKPMAGLARAYPKWKRQHDIAAAEQTR
tara:strand:- start:153 stop:692 length:540 start_codon:yes stop_codon:yes gene_type:complete